MTRRILRGLGVLMLAAACDKSSSVPAPSPTAPEPSVLNVRIGGPSVIEPGQSTQFSATAMLTDGTSRDVTGSAVWRVSNTPVFSVTSSGLVTASTVGEGSITISYQSRSASVLVVSLPAGTGILVGTVKEASFPVVGARIEVIGGPFTGRTVTSDSSGFYRLYGVAGDLQIRVSIGGYVTQTAQVAVMPFSTPRRDQVLNFNLSSSAAARDLAGNYRVLFTASSACSSRLRQDATTREYLARVTQEGSALTVVLGGAQFGVNSSGATLNRFDGRVRQDSVELAVGGDVYYYAYYEAWGFVEQLLQPPGGAWGFTDSNFLTVVGTAAGPATQSTIVATLDGGVAIYDAPRGFGGPRRQVGSCRARDHRLTFTRQ